MQAIEERRKRTTRPDALSLLRRKLEGKSDAKSETERKKTEQLTRREKK